MAQQRALCIAAGPVDKSVDGALQQHDNAALFQPCPILGTQHRAAARGQNDTRFARNLIEHLLLPVAKAGFTLAVEYPGNGRSCARFDHLVGIEKAIIEQICEHASHGAFAHRHKSDENDVGLWAGLRRALSPEPRALEQERKEYERFHFFSEGKC